MRYIFLLVTIFLSFDVYSQDGGRGPAGNYSSGDKGGNSKGGAERGGSDKGAAGGRGPGGTTDKLGNPGHDNLGNKSPETPYKGDRGTHAESIRENERTPKGREINRQEGVKAGDGQVRSISQKIAHIAVPLLKPIALEQKEVIKKPRRRNDYWGGRQ
jgi:hypothetical protein